MYDVGHIPWSSFVYPQITAVEQNVVEMARIAVRLLLEKIDIPSAPRQNITLHLYDSAWLYFRRGIFIALIRVLNNPLYENPLCIDYVGHVATCDGRHSGT